MNIRSTISRIYVLYILEYEYTVDNLPHIYTVDTLLYIFQLMHLYLP